MRVSRAARRLFPTLTSVNDYDSERIERLERKVDYLIRYLGIDPAHIAGGSCRRPARPTPTACPGVEVAPRSEVSDAGLGLVYDALRRRKKSRRSRSTAS